MPPRGCSSFGSNGGDDRARQHLSPPGSGNILAVGTHFAEVQLWDVAADALTWWYFMFE
ncbi:hypothetical protein T484DRAFT_1827570 [Baffinella frigidus]|nr:hypothetical protein T484DRAFT_1827570 [Cryptophyta sp. CCMP2293]